MHPERRKSEIDLLLIETFWVIQRFILSVQSWKDSSRFNRICFFLSHLNVSNRKVLEEKTNEFERLKLHVMSSESEKSALKSHLRDMKTSIENEKRLYEEKVIFAFSSYWLLTSHN